MFAALIAGAFLSLASAHPDPCATALPRGPAVPAPLVLSTDCGWFSLATDGTVQRLPVDWYATHKKPWHPPYGLSYRRTHVGQYLALRHGRVVWRSARRYLGEDGAGVFGPHSFAFVSWGLRGVLLSNLHGPERLVLHGRNLFPIGFTATGELVVSGRRTIVVLSPRGQLSRRLSFRASSSFAFDEATGGVYFVSPAGVLTVAEGSHVLRLGPAPPGSIALLGQRLLSFSLAGHVAVVRRSDGGLVASASWSPRTMIDSGVSVSDDGTLFAFRTVRGNTRKPGWASVYALRAGAHRAQLVYRHRFQQAGCGYSASIGIRGSELLYRSDGGQGPAEADLLRLGGTGVRLTPLLEALPRKSDSTPGNVFWPADFRM
jgi:hypothetical protein